MAPGSLEDGCSFLQVLDFSVALNISEIFLCGMSVRGGDGTGTALLGVNALTSHH